MARFFDAQAALAALQTNPIHPIHPIPSAKNRTNSTNRVPPDADAFEERAAIIEFDGGLGRHEAEDLAAQAQGYDNVIAMKSALSMREDGHE